VPHTASAADEYQTLLRPKRPGVRRRGRAGRMEAGRPLIPRPVPSGEQRLWRTGLKCRLRLGLMWRAQSSGLSKLSKFRSYIVRASPRSLQEPAGTPKVSQFGQ
jgi:hypothetical protein